MEVSYLMSNVNVFGFSGSDTDSTKQPHHLWRRNGWKRDRVNIKFICDTLGRLFTFLWVSNFGYLESVSFRIPKKSREKKYLSTDHQKYILHLVYYLEDFVYTKSHNLILFFINIISVFLQVHGGKDCCFFFYVEWVYLRCSANYVATE